MDLWCVSLARGLLKLFAVLAKLLAIRHASVTKIATFYSLSTALPLHSMVGRHYSHASTTFLLSSALKNMRCPAVITKPQIGSKELLLPKATVLSITA